MFGMMSADTNALLRSMPAAMDEIFSAPWAAEFSALLGKGVREKSRGASFGRR